MLDTTLPPPPATSCPREAADPRWALAVAILGSTMAFLDSTVVNVALPILAREFHAAMDSVQWIVESYALMLAALVLAGGALGDALGRRRVFVAGVILFTISSGGCGLAPDMGWLVASRGVQGVGAAMLVPGSLALIGAAYPEDQRAKAIGTWSAVTSMAAGLGPLFGGWVMMHFSWRAVFFFNVPLGALVAVMATRRVPDTRDPAAGDRLDWTGALIATLALGAIVWALLEAPRMGGISAPGSAVPLFFGVLLLVVFVRFEGRTPRPMVPLSLFRSGAFAGANLLTLLLYAALGAGLFFVPFELIQVNRYSPAEAGAALVPFVGAISLLSRWTGGLVPRYGARLPLVVGPLVAGVGFVLLAVPSAVGSYWSTLFPGIFVLGVGMGITVAPLTATVMMSVSEDHAGVASGINNAVSRTAGLLAVAALGIVVVARFDAAFDRELDALHLPGNARAAMEQQRGKLAGAEPPKDLDDRTRTAIRGAVDRAFVDGFRVLMFTCAGLAALSAGAARALVPPRP